MKLVGCKAKNKNHNSFLLPIFLIVREILQHLEHSNTKSFKPSWEHFTFLLHFYFWLCLSMLEDCFKMLYPHNCSQDYILLPWQLSLICNISYFQAIRLKSTCRSLVLLDEVGNHSYLLISFVYCLSFK